MFTTIETHDEGHTPKSRGGLVIISLLMITALITLNIGSVGSDISKLQTGAVIAPLLFGLTIMDMGVRTKNLGLFLPPGGNLHTLFLVVFMLVIFFAFFRNNLTPFGAQDEYYQNVKFFWTFMCSFLSYFMIIYWANRNKIPAEQLMVVLFYVVTGITILGIFTLVTGLNIPGLETQAWNVREVRGAGGAAGSLRAPFLEVYGQIGFILALTSIGCRGKARVFVLAYFAFCIFIGGGRATLLSTIAGFIIWLYLNRKFLPAFLLVLAAVVALVFAQFLNKIAPSPQLKRLSNIAPLEQSSVGRHRINEHLIKEFLDHPVFGTGYGKIYDFSVIRSGRRFLDPATIEKQLSFGSHGTHLQILKNIGLVGYIPFILIWLYPVYKLMPIAMARTGEYPWAQSRDAQICIIFISTLLLRMIVTGNGSESRLYIIAAIITSVISQVARHNARPGVLQERHYKQSVRGRLTGT